MAVHIGWFSVLFTILPDRLLACNWLAWQSRLRGYCRNQDELNRMSATDRNQDEFAQNVCDFVLTNVLILSKSSFSLVPALFNPNTVVYTPFWHQPLANWTVVPQSLVDAHTKNIQT